MDLSKSVVTTKIIKVLLSLWLIFHLVFMVLYPNSSSYLNRSLGEFFLNYANLIGLHSKWQFFAPEPEISNYLEYEIDPKEGVADVLNPITGKWPRPKRGLVDPFYNREATSKTMMFLFPNLIDKFFIPWLCRQHPEAAGITVRKVLVNLQNIDRVREGRSIFDPQDVRYGEETSASCLSPFENQEESP